MRKKEAIPIETANKLASLMIEAWTTLTSDSAPEIVSGDHLVYQ